MERRVGLQLDVQLDQLPDLPPNYEVDLYHIIVEALNNVVKHAAAGVPDLAVDPDDGHLHLQIVDDGRGYDPTQTTGGMGLGNIRERVARLNGEFAIPSEPGGGTRLEAMMPYCGGGPMSDLIRILIADDHYVVRQGLTTLLMPRNGMEVVGEAATGGVAVDLAHRLQPDVILMDMMMPEMDGPEAIRLIKQENPAARILVLTSFGESKQVSAAIQAGALGYLLKDSSPDDLLHAIRSVNRGNLVLPQDLAKKLMQPQQTAAALDQLTDRETDVLRLLARGQSNHEIARSLSISATTVRSHVSNILLKLGVANRTRLPWRPRSADYCKHRRDCSPQRTPYICRGSFLWLQIIVPSDDRRPRKCYSVC